MSKIDGDSAFGIVFGFLMILWTLFCMAVPCAVIYIAWHFLSKYW